MKNETWVLWHGDEKIVASGPVCPGANMEVVTKKAFDEQQDVLKELVLAFENMKKKPVNMPINFYRYLGRAKKLLNMARSEPT